MTCWNRNRSGFQKKGLAGLEAKAQGPPWALVPAGPTAHLEQPPVSARVSPIHTRGLVGISQAGQPDGFCQLRVR